MTIEGMFKRFTPAFASAALRERSIKGKFTWHTKRSGMLTVLTITAFCASHLSGDSQVVLNAGTNPLADTRWIQAQGTEPQAAAVYHFRKVFEMEALPESLIVHVSADNRYKLFVNGREVCHGPARGDLENWQFESAEVARHLRLGRNVIAAVVWNAGPMKPWAQITSRSAFILKAVADGSTLLETDGTWKACRNSAYDFVMGDALSRFPKGTGPGEEFDAADHPWGWATPEFPDSSWSSAEPVMDRPEWNLVPRSIPFMKEVALANPEVRRIQVVSANSEEMADGGNGWHIPPGEKVEILLDWGSEVIAYPEIQFSGGRDATIMLTYAEALFERDGKKAHRDRIESMEVKGLHDLIRPDGSQNRSWRPLWYRTFRYMQLSVETRGEAVRIPVVRATETGYPFKLLARFESLDPLLDKIWGVSWRTAMNCAHETYVDCPYYEQLNYTGDTRIQALISLAVTGDDRLMRQAIEHFHQSRRPNGLTVGSYPGSSNKKLPTYSLLWISMIHDHWMWKNDVQLIERYAETLQGILGWFQPYLRENLLAGLPDDSWDRSRNFRFDYWNYVDASKQWQVGVPPGVWEGKPSSVLSLCYAYALDHAADLMEAIGKHERAIDYRNSSRSIGSAVMNSCWDQDRALLADTPDLNTFSQHANVMAILLGLVQKDEMTDLMKRTLEDSSLNPCSLYFRFYLHEALFRAGLGDAYIGELDLWREMLALGLTTFPEHPSVNTRSDCHAWSAHPMYGFLTITAGIRPDSPGFASVRITPCMGDLVHLKAAMPHPLGLIHAEYKRDEGRLHANVFLPGNLHGTFEWQGSSQPLRPGLNALRMENQPPVNRGPVSNGMKAP